MSLIVLLVMSWQAVCIRGALLLFSRSDNSWKQGRFFFFGLFILTSPVKTAVADESTQAFAQRAGSGNPMAGETLSASERCQECHGADGNNSDSRIPKHAGQYAGYLIKQLRNFQSGERQHEVMTIMAEDLSETDMADIAAYFASQKTMQGTPTGVYPQATRLFFDGDKARDIRACNQCHGANGKGGSAGNVAYPVIGGQNKIYLRSQLVSWKLGERHNSPEGIMNKIAKSLTDDEIEQLANYLSGL